MGLMTHSKVVESFDKAVLRHMTDNVEKFEVHGEVAGGSSAPRRLRGRRKRIE